MSLIPKVCGSRARLLGKITARWRLHMLFYKNNKQWNSVSLQFFSPSLLFPLKSDRYFNDFTASISIMLWFCLIGKRLLLYLFLVAFVSAFLCIDVCCKLNTAWLILKHIVKLLWVHFRGYQMGNRALQQILSYTVPFKKNKKKILLLCPFIDFRKHGVPASSYCSKLSFFHEDHKLWPTAYKSFSLLPQKWLKKKNWKKAFPLHYFPNTLSFYSNSFFPW